MPAQLVAAAEPGQDIGNVPGTIAAKCEQHVVVFDHDGHVVAQLAYPRVARADVARAGDGLFHGVAAGVAEQPRQVLCHEPAGEAAEIRQPVGDERQQAAGAPWVMPFQGSERPLEFGLVGSGGCAQQPGRGEDRVHGRHPEPDPGSGDPRPRAEVSLDIKLDVRWPGGGQDALGRECERSHRVQGSGGRSQDTRAAEGGTPADR